MREFIVLTLSGVGLYLMMRAVSPAASLADALTVAGLTMALANLLAWLPMTGLVKDGAMVALLVPLYGSAAIALGVVIAWRIWVTLVSVSWAGIAAAVAGAIGSP